MFKIIKNTNYNNLLDIRLAKQKNKHKIKIFSLILKN